MPILQPVGTALVQEVDIFDEQAEERDDDLQDERKEGFEFSAGGGFPHDSQVCVVSANTDSKAKRTIDKEDAL